MLQIDSSDSILIDGRDTGLKLTQRREGSVVYTPESAITGRKYQEHKMPYARYSAAHDAPSKPGQPYDPNVTAGRAQLEGDVKNLVLRLKVYADEDAAFAKKMQSDVDYDDQQRAAGNSNHL